MAEREADTVAQDQRKESTERKAGPARNLAKLAIGTILTGAGITHLTVARKEFQAQVPNWFPAKPDTVVLGSGVAEIALGLSHLAFWRQPARGRVGAVGAAFFTIIFPGNISQYTEHKDGFGLDTDRRRFVRLLFQPLLVAAALAGGNRRRGLAR